MTKKKKKHKNNEWKRQLCKKWHILSFCKWPCKIWNGIYLFSFCFLFLFLFIFQVTHLWNDQAIRKVDEHLEHEYLRQCFYRGRVRGDEHSVVTVSLCGGMVSFILISFKIKIAQKSGINSILIFVFVLFRVIEI